MDCPSCGHRNREGARYCAECGTPVGATVPCPACGVVAHAGQRFCDACGHAFGDVAPAAEPGPAPSAPAPALPEHLAAKARTHAAALAGERKRVTVLFADVQGSMDLAGALDPEDWRAIMERFFSILCAGVHRFEGTVDKFTGDGIMALFGAPIAHEDHAARACYAALHLRDELASYAAELRRERGLGFSVRMGINSGEVVVGAIGDDLSLDYTAIGHTVGLAQRMEQLAEPGKTYLTKDTAALVEGYFALGDLGEFAVKGADAPLQVYELQATGPLRTRLEVAAARGLSRFVGRVEETAVLEAAWELAEAGDTQVVGIVAEAGVGKSRLCFEFAQRCRARGVAVYEAHAVAHSMAVPFVPVLEFLRGYFGIADADDDRTARDKVAGRLLMLDEEFRDALPLMFEFLGVPDPERPAPRMDPEARQRQLFRALDRLLQARSAEAPGVILLEDLHWLDPGSEAFVANLMEGIPGTRTLVLATLRPEYEAEWMQRPHYRALPLLPLGDEAIEELLSHLLGADPSLDGLAELIRERTGGNPFFVEEVVQELAERETLVGERGNHRLAREVSEIAIPATVESLLTARIDRLSERDKSVLQTASVIGREFSEPVLARVCNLSREDLEAALRALTDGEFLHVQALYPVAEYVFKHALTEQVAYRSQLGPRRVQTHAAVASAIEELEPDRLDERAGLIAHHWEAAQDPLAAARWSARAAGWAGFTDMLEAARHWGKVRELTVGVEDEEAALLGLSARVMLVGFLWRLGAGAADLDFDADELVAEGEALADRTGQLGLKAILISAYSGVLGTTGRIDELLETSNRALRLAEESGDRGAHMAIMPFVAYGLFVVGRTNESLAACERALELAAGDRSLGAGLGLLSPYRWAELWRGTMLLFAGRVAEGRAELERVAADAREAGDLENQIWAHMNLAQVADMGGADAEFALAHARTAAELAQRAGGAFSETWTLFVLGVTHSLRGEWAEGVAALDNALALSRTRGTALEAEPLLLSRLARAWLGLGDAVGGRDAAQAAVDLAVQRGTRGHEMDARRELGRALLATEGPAAEARIRAELDRSLAMLPETGMVGYEPHAHAALAELATAIGDHEGAERELAEARRALERNGATESDLMLSPAAAG